MRPAVKRAIATMVFVGLLVGVAAVSPAREVKKPHITLLGFTIGESSLTEIAKKLGKTSFIEDPTRGNRYICYKEKSPPAGLAPLVVSFDTNELENEERKLVGFSVRRGVMSGRTLGACRIARFVTQELSTESGIRLGLARTALIRLLGKPQRAGKLAGPSGGTSLSYQYEDRRTHVLTAFDGELDTRDKLSAFAVFHFASK